MEKLGEVQATIEEHDELMDEKVRLECVAAHEIAELNEALEEEQANREAIESLTKELAKIKDSYENAMCLANDYYARICEIEYCHRNPFENFDKLEKDHKSLTSEYKSLKESSDHLHLLYSLVKKLISNDKDA